MLKAQFNKNLVTSAWGCSGAKTLISGADAFIRGEASFWADRKWGLHWIRPEDTASGCVTVNEPKCRGGGDEGEKPLPGWLCSRPPTELCVHAPMDRPHALCLLQGHCCPGHHSQMCPTHPRVPTHRGLPCPRTLADQPGTGSSTFRDRAAHIWSETRWVLQTKEKAPGWGQSLCPFVRAPDNTPCSGPRCHRSGLLGSVSPSHVSRSAH